MKYEDIENMVSEYCWLLDIADKYRQMIACMEREQEYFRLHSLEYSARGDVRKFDINCHRSIPVKYLIEGLGVALSGIEEEMKQLKSKLDAINVEVCDKNKLLVFKRALQEQRNSRISLWINMLKCLLWRKRYGKKEG